MSSPAIKREDPAQEEPSRPIRDFPKRRIEVTDAFFRAHSKHQTAWWFSSSGQGRFDITTGMKGTCYLADHPRTAIRERVGAPLVKLGYIHYADAIEMCVSMLSLPDAMIVADLNDVEGESGNHAVTNELSAGAPYAISQSWARAFADEGLQGIYYRPRFDPARNAMALAIFSDRGARTASSEWQEDPARKCGVSTVVDAGIEVRDTPKVTSLTIIRPARPSQTKG